jgi:hypothetical protein
MIRNPFSSAPRFGRHSYSIHGLLPALVLVSVAGAANLSSSAMREPAHIKVEGKPAFVLGFDRLSAFEYVIVDAGTGASADEIEVARKRDQIPPWIRLYDGERVQLTGYLLPLSIEKDGQTKKFIMMKDVNTCCYGAVPNMNDYVIVTMKTGGAAPVQDVPVMLVGVFRVAEKYEGGYVTSLFEMDGEKFLGAKK